jgi:formylglycine-generating enzyme required for sulfatase activity
LALKPPQHRASPRWLPGLPKSLHFNLHDMRKKLITSALALTGGAAIAAAWLAWGGKVRPAGLSERLHCALPAQPLAAPHPGMIWVPGGSFDLGDTVYVEEGPVRRTAVAGFWMDRTEVTNDEFADFVKATGYVTVAEREVDVKAHPGLSADLRRPGAVVFTMPHDLRVPVDLAQWWRYLPGANWRHPGGPQTDLVGRGSFPVVTVTIADARAYAAWKGRDLPSEAQWEWAARAGQPEAARDHDQPAQANTWQGRFPVVNSGDDGFVGLAPVGCFAANAWGLFDLIGNVWELTTDAWTPNHAPVATVSPVQVPPDLRAGTVARRVIKGGSFLCAPNYCMRYRSGAREPQEDDLGASHLGFRTILNAPGP